MTGIVYEDALLVDTSAVVALFNRRDARHRDARDFAARAASLPWFALDVTAHESFTRLRYDAGFSAAACGYAFLRSGWVNVVGPDASDEDRAARLLQKYRDHRFSFHDALCASVMRRVGLLRAFTFDKDFQIMGFETLPEQFR